MKSASHTLLAILLLGGGAALPAPSVYAGDVSVGVSVGVRLPRGAVRVRVGHERYYYHHGVYYRHTPRGYVIVRAPHGARVRALPHSHVRVVVGGGVYYRDADVYYRAVPGGYYEVCEPPVVVVREEAPPRPPPPPPASAAGEIDANGYLPLWLNESPYYFKAGQFYRKAPEGYVWVEAPIGATAKHLPGDAVSVWHDEQEYFESGNVLFKATRDGFMVVEAPWKPAK